jgi:hypothetical protein
VSVCVILIGGSRAFRQSLTKRVSHLEQDNVAGICISCQDLAAVFKNSVSECSLSSSL